MLRLPRRDGDFDSGIWPDMVAVMSIMPCVPMLNPSLLGQVSEIADEVCDGMLVCRFALSLKHSDDLCGPSNMVGFIGHGSPRLFSRLIFFPSLLAALERAPSYDR
jgi:hypothetical protein